MIFKMPSGFEDVKETCKKELLLFIDSEVYHTLFY